MYVYMYMVFKGRIDKCIEREGGQPLSLTTMWSVRKTSKFSQRTSDSAMFPWVVSARELY